ncbi:IMPACT family protein [Sanguibacter suaedae]|uniref:YigZ family protein n=1 Tax=Sanguibacter suaedae TaxID=2795737 RepID=A0A934IFR3_9MICO|nr:YigZ family protein [Sanguibacter suaedae]MBI9116169.1 YigZ family protein [Sanguibacter suaedae]
MSTSPSGPVPSLPSTVAGASEHTTVVKKSRFLTHLEHVASVAEADAVIARVRKDRWDARHHCVALVVGTDADQQRSSDDGEPAGTAGIPMLEVLRHRSVTDVVAVVSRYFGGVLLGAGGLVRAYSGAVADALDRTPAVHRALMERVLVDVPYEDVGRVESAVRDWAGTHRSVLVDVEYGTSAVLTLLVPPDRVDVLDGAVAAWSAGTLDVVRCGSAVVDLPGDVPGAVPPR